MDDIERQEIPTSGGDDAPELEPSTAAIDAGAEQRTNLRAPELYLNRELTWLQFNRRVLSEAQDRRTPLLERVKFLAICDANLDEFFMKRIGGLKQQVGAGVLARTVDGRTPQQQIDECYAAIRAIIAEEHELVLHLIKLLRKNDIHIARYYDELDAKQQATVRDYYLKNIFPLVTPQAVDPAHPFPFISNLSLNLLVTLRYKDQEDVSMARVKVPVGKGIPRFLRVEGEGLHFIPLEQVMAANLDLLFPGMHIESCDVFRVTRNANTETAEEQADDLLNMIESELRDRRFAPIVRLGIGKGMNPVRRGMLAAELGLDEAADVFEVEGMLALGHLWEIAGLDAPTLHDPPHHPVDHPRLADERSMFHIIREAPLLLQHPYEAFSSSVVRFVREAAEDPNVLAIKCTLYRTGQNSKIIEHLIEAARRGKQVAVVVELKARFDEEANIRWAARLEQVGIHVTYGVVGLKTHCKVILVVRRDYDGLRRYAHIGTGNYHEDTARVYSDLGLLTSDDAIGRDLTELFNYLTTGYTPARNYKKLLPAPKQLKKALLAKIDREIAHQRHGAPALIQFKMNALEDVDITRALYRASQAGVKIDLIVRDTCRLRPGMPGVSETVSVVSIVGRFLEHARVYYFKNGGEDEYYIGSADVMTRNLVSRVEVVAPIEEPALRDQLRQMLDVQLADQRSGWDMQPDGTYVQRQGERARSSQQQLIEVAERRFKQATRLKMRKPQGLKSRNR